MQPSLQPTVQPTVQPSGQPTAQPSTQPTGQPSVQPTGQPSVQPTALPTTQPSVQPTVQPTEENNCPSQFATAVQLYCSGPCSIFRDGPYGCDYEDAVAFCKLKLCDESAYPVTW